MNPVLAAVIVNAVVYLLTKWGISVDNSSIATTIQVVSLVVTGVWAHFAHTSAVAKAQGARRA